MELTHSHLCYQHYILRRASFDDEEKKHWLNVHKGELVGRYMLQDNLRPAWHSDERSVPEKICDAVDAMIMKVDQEGDKRRSDLK